MANLQAALMSLGTGIEGELTRGTYVTNLSNGVLTITFINDEGDEVVKVEMSKLDQPNQQVDVEVAEWANT